MKKNKEKSSPTSKLLKKKTNSPSSKHQSQNQVNDTQSIKHAFCICSRCHKLCLITPDFWIPPVQGSPKKPISQIETKNYQIFFEKKWEFDDNFSAFKQNSFLNNHFLFPCCPACIDLLTNQIKLNNDFYVDQQIFLNSTENQSSFIKNTYLLKAETKINTLQKESASLIEIVNANKANISAKQNIGVATPSNFHYTKDGHRMSDMNSSDLSDSPKDNENSTSNDSNSKSKDDDKNDNQPQLKRIQTLSLKDDRIQSQSSVTFSLRSFGFCGLTLCFSFRITTHRHYGCINGMRLGTMTPNRVPTKEFDQALFFLAQLIKIIGSLAKVDIPNLVISSSIFLYEELKYDQVNSNKSKASTTDALSNRGVGIDGLGKMKLKMKVFEKPKLIKLNDDNDDDEPISLSKMTKSEKRELSGSADSLKPRFYSSEAVQLTANDLKTLRGVQIFRKAISILMKIIYSVLASPAISSHFSFPYELENGGQSINGISFDYDKQNPGAFTHAMKLLLFDIKSIQAKALEEDVDRITDEWI